MLMTTCFVQLLGLLFLDFIIFKVDKYSFGLANYRDDWRCGAGYPAPNGEGAICPCGCCSNWNYCGITNAHCLCTTCVDQRSLCPTEPPPTTPAPIIPPELPVFYAEFENNIGKCLMSAGEADVILKTGTSTRCGKACLMFSETMKQQHSYTFGCQAFGFDRGFSGVYDCFIYNTTAWVLEDTPTYIRRERGCSFYVMLSH